MLRRLLLLLAALLAAPAAAQTFPTFTGYVVDDAHLLPPADAQALAARLAALQKDTSRQLVVATIPDLQGYAIEDYGYRLGRAWGVGDKQRDDGAILIVAPAARRVRVEVGYGLTPVLTDALSSVIINQTIVPRFKAGDMAGGVAAGADALIAQLRLPDADAKQRVADAGAARSRPAHGGGGAPLSLIFWGVVLAFVLLSMLRGRGGRRYRGGWGGPVVLWGPGWGGGGSGWGGGGSSWGGSDGGGFSGGGGGSFGGGGASGSW